jgi:hypothetical protein
MLLTPNDTCEMPPATHRSRRARSNMLTRLSRVTIPRFSFRRLLSTMTSSTSTPSTTTNFVTKVFSGADDASMAEAAALLRQSELVAFRKKKQHLLSIYQKLPILSILLFVSQRQRRFTDSAQTHSRRAQWPRYLSPKVDQVTIHSSCT